MKRLATAALLGALSLGASDSHKEIKQVPRVELRLETILKRFGIKVNFNDGPLIGRENIIDILSDYLGKLHSNLLCYLSEISIGDLPEDWSLMPLYAAETDVETGHVFIRPEDIDLNVLAHEAAHAYLGNIPGFYERWKQLVEVDPESEELSDSHIRDMDDPFNLQSLVDLPFLGFLSRYGSKLRQDEKRNLFWVEDPATYVESVYADGYRPFRFANPDDPRYVKKLELLRDVGAISQEQYLGVLRVLGKDYNNREMLEE